MLGKRIRVLSVLCIALLTASAVSAQRPVRLSLSGAIFSTNLNTETTAGDALRVSGISAGGAATVALGRMGLGIRYLEGSLSPSGGGTSRALVEGEAMLSARALSWLSFKFGPHIRSFIQNNATERWVFWETRIRTETELGTRQLTSSLEFWQILSGSANTTESFDGGQGIEGSLRWEFSSRPLWLNLGYRIDRSNLGGGSRTEVLEHIVLGVGYGRIRMD
jgi:hypothetical protein